MSITTRLDCFGLRGLPSMLGARRLVGAVLWAAAVGGCSERTSPPPLPTVSSVSPTNGPLAGGTAVTITGANIPAVVDSVRFGTGRLGGLVRVSAIQLTGTTPTSATAGAVDVVAFTSSAGNASCPSCYTYNPLVTVSGVSPAGGRVSGGTTVTIAGTNFPATVDSVRVGTVRLGSVVRVSTTQLTGATAAASRAGTVDVVVYTTSQGSGTCAGCFTYNPWGTSLTAGNSHTCALTVTGAAYCWGNRFSGQVGDGSTAFPYPSTPVPVAGGITFASLAAGLWHTCGLTGAGAAYCWGDNTYGQLGDESTTQRTTPVAVRGGIAFESLVAGYGHTCGLTLTGAAYCWGGNYIGQLGIGASDTLPHPAPMAVVGGLRFVSLTAGAIHTCGLISSGAAYCWGDNYEGELGLGSYDSLAHTAPVAVGGGFAFSSLVAAQNFTCGLTSTGVAHCWGWNTDGELGDGSTTNGDLPGAVAGGLIFASLTARGQHTCGVSTAGVGYCWGDNYYGQVGDSATVYRSTPAAVAGGLAFATLAAGQDHTCGLTVAGAAYCWGGNYAGQVGDGSNTQRHTPTAVVNP